MELELALLADFANKSADGKLNILGTFNQIFSLRYPSVHPELKLVLRFAVHPAELGETKKVRIQLRGYDGQVAMQLDGEMKLNRPPTAPSGEILHVDNILGINGLPIPAAGRYEFVIMVNGEVKGSASFTASLRQQTPALPEGEQPPEGT